MLRRTKFDPWTGRRSLAATGTPIDVFVQLISDSDGVVIRESIPMIGLSQAGKAGFFDAAGHPASHGWDEIPFPAVTDEHAYRSRFPEIPWSRLIETTR
jgi:hypothetical protein